MDISQIDTSKATAANGLIIGEDSAPIKMVEFINVRCPYCKQWFEEKDQLLTAYVNEGKLQRIIKFLDKEKESLQPGNVMHRYINYELPLKGLADLRQIFNTQDQWGHMPLEEVAQFAEDNLQLAQMNNQAIAEHTIAEAAAANIKFVPTVIINNHIFDENITEEELISILEEKN